MPMRSSLESRRLASSTIFSKFSASESPGMPGGVSMATERAAMSMPSSLRERSSSATFSGVIGICEISTAL